MHTLIIITDTKCYLRWYLNKTLPHAGWSQDDPSNISDLQFGKKKQNIFQSIWKENINSGNKDINSGNEDINSIWKKQNKTKKTHQFGEKNRPTQAKLQEINLNLF